MVQKEHIPFLKDSEHIVMILHRHWIIFIFKILYIIFLLLSSILLIMIREEIMSFIGGGLFWGFMSLYWISFLTFIFLSWVTDELDIFIITNERIIGIDQISALSRIVTECSIDRVQEVNAEVSGILQTIFNYGHVHIHTASEHSNMTISFAPNPVDNARQINNVIHEFRGAHTPNRAKPASGV